MLPASRLFVSVVLLATALPPLTARAQVGRGTVIYAHLPNRLQRQVWYRLPGDPSNIKRDGVPSAMRVRVGEQACVEVENANPVLYTYDAAAANLIGEDPKEAAQIAEILSALLERAGAAGAAAGGNPIADYIDAVANLHRTYTELAATRKASDRYDDFPLVVAEVRRLNARALEEQRRAEEKFEAIDADDRRTNFTVRMVRDVQQNSAEGSKAIFEEFDKADPKVERCVTVTENMQRVTLAVRFRESGKSARLTGDSVIAFTVEPVLAKSIEIGAGAIASIAPRGQQQFGVRDGVVTGGPDDRTPMRAAAFLLARSWGPEWLWGAVGFSGDKSGVSTLFLGPALRFGGSVVGTRLTLAAGWALTRVPVSLKDGAIGQPLPSNIKDIDEITERAMRSALGVSIMLSGFKP
jgi:hypothetical protein